MTLPGDDAPLPPAASHLAQYLDGLAEGRLMFQRCLECGEGRLPPRVRCPACGSAAVGWQEASGRGEVWARCVFHKAYGPEYRERVPYTVVTVQLEEGVRLLSNVVGPGPEGVQVGMPVIARAGRGDAGVPVVVFHPSS